MINGKIIKGIGGFYYVETAEAVYECKARGNFRKMNLSPLVGDNVDFSVNENAENRIEAILPRKNSLVLRIWNNYLLCLPLLIRLSILLLLIG